MFGSLGAPELLFILGLALLIFGPSKLPELGRTMGKAMAEFRKAATDFKRTLNVEAMEREMREADPRRAVNDTLAQAKKDLDDVLHPKSSSSGPPAAESTDEPEKGTEEPEAADEPKAAAGTVARGSDRDPADRETSDRETSDDDESTKTEAS